MIYTKPSASEIMIHKSMPREDGIQEVMLDRTRGGKDGGMADTRSGEARGRDLFSKF